jgi:hypothetical protein
MRKIFSIASHATACLLAAGVLAGCASSMQPKEYISKSLVDGAMVADDQHLYLFSLGQVMRFDAAPFQRYRALMDSPAKEALACSLMVLTTDYRRPEGKAAVHGSYGVLLHAAQVTPAQAQELGLQRVDVNAKEAAAAKERAWGWLAKPPRTPYELGLDPACGLPDGGGSYYSAVFESDGRWVELPNRAALLEQSRWPKQLQGRQVTLHPPKKSSAAQTGLEAGGTVLGVVALPVVLPAMLLALPFLGPDHWK